jgi:hypothetical protein
MRLCSDYKSAVEDKVDVVVSREILRRDGYTEVVSRVTLLEMWDRHTDWPKRTGCHHGS